jgi:hypothetical protein
VDCRQPFLYKIREELPVLAVAVTAPLPLRSIWYGARSAVSNRHSILARESPNAPPN